MSRELQARRVLEALGKPAKRPSAPPPSLELRQLLCKNCDRQIVLATLPSGNRVPLDKEPDGELVIVNGVAITRGPQHADAPRYVLHFAACRRSEGAI